GRGCSTSKRYSAVPDDDQ
ncbi:unnamed protein product, partial [Rotaria sp. Silwood2]